MIHEWGKIFTHVWNNELSKQELLNIGIDVIDRKWRRLFGRSPNQANYFFCDKCENRHAIIPTGPGEFLALDESDRCEREYQISEQDLQLFMFKKQTFIQDLQRSAFDLSEPGPKKIGKYCWELGKLVDYYKVFFLHVTNKSELLQSLAHMREELTIEERPILILGISQKWFDAETIHLMESFKWYTIFLDYYLYLDNNGFIRSKTPLQQFNKLKNFIAIAKTPEKSDNIDEALKAFTKLDEEYKLKHPKAKPPFPSKVLRMRYKLDMPTEKIAKLGGCTPQKIRSILQWIPNNIKKAYQGDVVTKPGMRSLQTVEQANETEQDFEEENFPYQDPSTGDNSRIWASIR